MSYSWFRMYAEFAHDPVLQSLAFEDQRHYVMILCLKCAGVLDRNISAQSRNRIILRSLGLDSVAADEAKRRLLDVGLVDKNWQPLAWEKRQFISDSSTERARKSRKKKETGNVSATLPERSGNDPYTDTESDAEKNKSRAVALPDDFVLTTERLEYATRKGVLDPLAEFEAFREHHTAHGKRMKSWDAAWRTWCINYRKFGGATREANRKLSATEIVRAANPTPGETRGLIPRA